MERRKGYYALLQYSPFPERQEFVNVGVLLCVPEARFLRAQFVDSPRRIERVFGKQDTGFIKDQLKALEVRLEVEKSRYLDIEALEKFARLRANDLRLTSLLPASVAEPDEYLQALFDELVGEKPPRKQNVRIQSELKAAFERADVIRYLDRPAPVELAEYDVTISAPFGYQNGHFNMIDPMRLPEHPGQALEQAGRRAIEGGWLAKVEKDKRLIVVGDFSCHSDKFFDAVRDEMFNHQVRLHRLDNLQSLIEDIEESARLHGRAS